MVTREGKKVIEVGGERKLISIIRELLTKDVGTPCMDNIIKGIGDDSAILDLATYGGQPLYLLITTDTISQHTHIPREMTAWQVGWHIVAINLSDLAAMGGSPLAMVVALGLPPDYEVKLLKNLVKGMHTCGTKYNVPIVGGDTKRTRTLTITGTAIGIISSTDFMLREGCKVGDIVAVTGELGGAAAGYYCIRHKYNKNKYTKNAIKSLLEPEPRIREGIALAQTRAVHAAIDISDGLASSLYQLRELNPTVGFEIEFDKLPQAGSAMYLAQTKKLPIEDLILYYGGDYELLVTIEPGKLSNAISAVSAVGTKLTPIGKVTSNRKIVLIRNGKKSNIKNIGYNHFRSGST
jgi:thiamine-monophosphate kinase